MFIVPVLAGRDRATGRRIGGVTGTIYFLEPTASYQIDQSVAGTQLLQMSQQTLHQRLREGRVSSWPGSWPPDGATRRTLECVPRQVLHLKAKDLVGEIPEAN